MSSERWTRIEELFNAALEREPGERLSFLQGRCPDDPAHPPYRLSPVVQGGQALRPSSEWSCSSLFSIGETGQSAG